MKIAFLHIGKTGGNSLRTMLQAEVGRSGLDLIWHGHDVTLQRALAADPTRPIAFVYREPAERFVSVFWSRLRMGRPRNNSLWSPDEAIAFQWFSTPNDLAEALYSDDERLVSASRFAMQAVSHVRRGYAWSLGSTLELEKAAPRICFACDLAELDERLGELFQVIGHPAPAPGEHQHVRPEGRSTADELSDKARRNLERFLADDYLIYRYLTARFGGESGRRLREEADAAGEQAMEQYRARNWAEAITCCSRVLETRPLDRRALLLRARSLGQQDEHDAALKDWESVLFIEPDNSEALVTIGRSLHRAKRSGEAVAHLERALALDPEDANIRRLLLVVAEAAGDAEALRRTIRANGLTPGQLAQSDDWRPAASMFALERDEDAVETVCRARMTLRDGHESEARLMLARHLIRQQRLEEAENIVTPEQTGDDRALSLGLVHAALLRRDIGAARERLQLVRSQGQENQLITDTASAVDRLQAEISANEGLDRKGVAITALLGVSFCGSTMLGSMLGNLEGVGHVGESHRMIKSALKDARGNANAMFDFERGDPQELVQCEACGTDCAVFPFDFRRSLRDNPANWFFRLAHRLGVHHLVTGDKHMAPDLDPLERFNAVILFKPPEAAFRSHWRRNPEAAAAVNGPGQYADTYTFDYRRFLNRVRPEGQTICLNWIEFVAEPERHLRQLCEMLGLPHDPAALTRRDTNQHFFGGNPDVRREFGRNPARITLRPELATDPDDDLMDAIRRHQPMQAVYREMMRRYRSDFPAPGSEGENA